MVDKHSLLEVIMAILENSQLQDRVHQSALALLGHICTHCFGRVSVPVFLIKTAFG